MKRINLFTAIQVLVILFFSNHSAAQQSKDTALQEAKKAIAASNRIYFQAFVKGDSSIFIDRYATDCWIMPPDAPAMHGPDAPLNFFRTAYHKFGLRNGKFITTDVFGDGREYVTEVGIWQSFNANNRMFDNGKFLVLWKKTPKGWKMFRDSFSSDRSK